MGGLRFLAAVALGAACALHAVALLVDRFAAPRDDSLLGTTGLILALAFIAAGLVVRPAGARILPLFAIVPALVVAMYASWLLDPTPTDLPERDNLLFGIGLTSLWTLETVLRFERSTRVGVAGSLLLLLAVAVDIAGAVADNPLRPTTPAILLGAVALLLIAAWAARMATWDRGAAPLPDPGVIEPAAPKRLAWLWARPLPAGIPWLVSLAGLAGAAGALLRLPSGGNVQWAPLALAQAAFGVLWAIAVIRIVRAAPKVGRVTSVALVLVELAIPLGLFIPGVTGGLALAAPAVGPDPSRPGVSLPLPPDELVAGALGFVGISIARLGWVLLAGGRRAGLGAGAGLVAGAILVFFGGSPVDAGLAGLGRSVQSASLFLGGVWLLALGRRLRGVAPIAVFRAPADREGIEDPPVPRRLPAAGRHAPARQPFARQPRTASRHDLGDLARRLGIPPEELRSFRPTYTTFTIPKRSGGVRTITAPEPSTKAVQRRILRRLLARLPAHESAHGFERGRSIVTNAAVHRDPAVLVKLDIEDFFGRTRTARIRRYWRVIGWDREAAAVLTRLTTHGGGLPQGAPTSPRLANLVNVRLDARLTGIAWTHGARYTRYADDLTFSFERDDGPGVRQLIHAVQSTVRAEGRYRLHLHRKVEIRRPHERQAITGLVVNRGLPRLDRARRRWLRAIEHRRRSGGGPTIDDERLRGWHALETMIEVQAAEASGAARGHAFVAERQDDRDVADGGAPDPA